jgi:hypothetical protein
VRPGNEGADESSGGGTGDDTRHPGTTGGDVIDMAVEPVPRQRPVPWRIIAVIAALLVGGAVGYVAGDRHGRNIARPATSPSRTTVIKPTAAVSMTGRRCSVQIGKRLELGVEITNDLPRPLLLKAIEIGLPLGGLRVRSTAFGTCGAVGGNTGPQPLASGNSTWMSATFDVDVPCPRAYPVLFVAEYDSGYEAGKNTVGGFPDLGDVPYTGCTASGG